MTTIQFDNSDIAISYDKVNESWYVLQGGQQVARFNSYAKASRFADTL
jgi:hypothetical protein